jgi:hypothetical protein
MCFYCIPFWNDCCPKSLFSIRQNDGRLISREFSVYLATTVISMLPGPAYTKTIAEKPEIRLKQILQNPKYSTGAVAVGARNVAVRAHPSAPGTVMSEYPAVPHQNWLKASATIDRLPEVHQAFKKLQG